jgi:hydrogenase maturation protease
MGTTKPLVLALGNILMQDEGLGVHALNYLTERYLFPDDVQLLDGGTIGLALLPYVADATDLLILDCIDNRQAAGTLVRLEGAEVPAALAIKMSVHQVGLQDLLAASSLQGTLPQRLVLWGIQPASVDWGTALSPAVAACLDDLSRAVVQELQGWGMEVRKAGA